MAQGVKEFSAKPDDLSLILGNGENLVPQISSELHACDIAHDPTFAQNK